MINNTTPTTTHAMSAWPPSSTQINIEISGQEGSHVSISTDPYSAIPLSASHSSVLPEAHPSYLHPGRPATEPYRYAGARQVALKRENHGISSWRNTMMQSYGLGNQQYASAPPAPLHPILAPETPKHPDHLVALMQNHLMATQVTPEIPVSKVGLQQPSAPTLSADSTLSLLEIHREYQATESKKMAMEQQVEANQFEMRGLKGDIDEIDFLLIDVEDEASRQGLLAKRQEKMAALRRLSEETELLRQHAEGHRVAMRSLLEPLSEEDRQKVMTKQAPTFGTQEAEKQFAVEQGTVQYNGAESLMLTGNLLDEASANEPSLHVVTPQSEHNSFSVVNDTVLLNFDA